MLLNFTLCPCQYLPSCCYGLYCKANSFTRTISLRIIQTTLHCCYGGIENDWDFFGPNWSLRHENLETLIKTVVKFEILPTRAFQSTVFLLLIWALWAAVVVKYWFFQSVQFSWESLCQNSIILSTLLYCRRSRHHPKSEPSRAQW